MWWRPHEFEKKRVFLLKRAEILKSVRRFFDGEGFLEVETPILQICPVIDTHIRAFGTEIRGVDGQVRETLYLHTSPEFAMKKLMVAGLSKIYQICHVFRNAEGSSRHSAEFTMIEWYRTEADYTDIMRDCEGLLRAAAQAARVSLFRYKDFACDPFKDFERLSVCEAFERYAGLDLTRFLPPLSGETMEEGAQRKRAFREAVAALGLHTAEDDGWDDLFFRVMDAKIEPRLGMDQPTFLCDYPIAMASLSKPKAGDARFAERFELYVCGIELANAFSELTDAQEQRARYHSEMDEKERLYGERYPLDEEFIQALEHGLPPSGGIALGVDRLIMLATGASDIDQVLWCKKV